jgi:hypothetical protein
MNLKVLNVCLDVLDKKPITDEQARKNYKEVIWDYIRELSTLEPLNISPDSKAYIHKEYLVKLISLGDRYASIGNEALPSNTEKIDVFLKKLQDMMRDYQNRDLYNVFYSLRKEHYTKLAFNQRGDEGIPPPTVIANLKEQAFRNIGKNLG